MEYTEQHLLLSGSQTLIPHGAKDGYRVLSGTVLVYVVPWKQEAPGRRLLLCEVPEGRIIPSFVYRDQQYDHWRFCLVAKDEARLERMENCATSVLYRNFAKRAGLTSFEQEGFEQSLVEFYRRESLKDNIYIGRGKARTPEVNRASFGVIKKAFDAGQEVTGSADPLYRTVAYACRKASIPVEKYEKVAAACKKDITVDAIARISRFICRSVVLEPNWFREDCGVLISDIDGEPVACVPGGKSGYMIYRGKEGTAVPLTAAVANTINPRANSLGRTLPDRALKPKDLLQFAIRSLNRRDLAAILILGLISALIGILLPQLNQILYDDYIPLGNYGQLIQLCLVICTFMVGNLFFGMVKTLSEFRLRSRVGYDLQNAVYHRVFHLPESFFRQYDSADLAQRLASVANMSNSFVSTIVITGLSTLFSLLYLFRMYKYSAKLAWISLAMLAVYGLLIYWISTQTRRYEKRITECSGEASSRLYQYLNGIEKIRIAGVEDQAAYEYLIPFAQQQQEAIRKNRLEGIHQTLSTVISTVFSMVLYYTMIRSKASITMGSFIAFNTAFGIFSGAVLELLEGLIGLQQLRPSFARLRPVLDTAPEDSGSAEFPGTLTGAVTLDHVTFSYDEGGRKILNDLSLEIRPGEYLGIVGPSGCGKSTLLKLLLGFEEPVTGQVRYDSHDLKSLDKRELRKHLGVVLQNGKLIAGSIYENITIPAPHATMKDVQAVVEAVGLKEDIAQMPMGLHTVLSENSGTISGGQQQRILIARAIISHPSILIFDEATSALDNLTQAAVCESLDKMNVTRIVVAHRLSTIRSCDRILVLQNGTIAEEGNYERLMARRGLFYQLASRQLVDEGEDQ